MPRVLMPRPSTQSLPKRFRYCDELLRDHIHGCSGTGRRAKASRSPGCGPSWCRSKNASPSSGYRRPPPRGSARAADGLPAARRWSFRRRLRPPGAAASARRRCATPCPPRARYAARYPLATRRSCCRRSSSTTARLAPRTWRGRKTLTVGVRCAAIPLDCLAQVSVRKETSPASTAFGRSPTSARMWSPLKRPRLNLRSARVSPRRQQANTRHCSRFPVVI